MKRAFVMVPHTLKLTFCARQSSPGDEVIWVEAPPDRPGLLLCSCLAVGHTP